ncbi:MAG: FtsX-like permease family protein, partial [Bacteroidota bacterium]
EIGIRKVYGASVTDILKLVSREYTIMVLIATLLAIPAFYYLANLWLDNFAYRITPSVFFVAAAGLLCLLTVVPLVILQSYQTAKMNPADTLRSE